MGAMPKYWDDLPYKLDAKGVPVHIETGHPWRWAGTYKGTQYKRSYIKQVLQLQQQQTTRPRMTILAYASKFYLRNKDGQVHATRYKSREDAAAAAQKMASGLIHFSPTIIQINNANLSNKT